MELEELISKTMALNILYVEDDEILRVSTVGVLENFFENILVATNGLEALEVFKNNQVDIILTDISMPKMDGVELIRNIRDTNKDIPVLVISAFNETDVVEEVEELGISGYIFKPIELSQMCEQLENAVR